MVLILSPTTSIRIDCLRSYNHSSNYSFVLHQYFPAVLKISLFYNVYFLFLFDNYSFAPSPPVSLVSWISFKFSPFSRSVSPVLPSSVSFVCRINKLFNFFKALFNTDGIFRLSILFFKVQQLY